MLFYQPNPDLAGIRRLLTHFSNMTKVPQHNLAFAQVKRSKDTENNKICSMGKNLAKLPVRCNRSKIN
jgi:hypothetical protein